MTDDRAALDDLLCRWYAWQQDYRPVRGFSGVTRGLSGYRSSQDQHDNNEDADDRTERMTMRVVDEAVAKLPEEFRIALHQDARNLVAGAEVVRSPRLPSNGEIRRFVVDSARAMLTAKLRRAALMGD